MGGETIEFFSFLLSLPLLLVWLGALFDRLCQSVPGWVGRCVEATQEGIKLKSIDCVRRAEKKGARAKVKLQVFRGRLHRRWLVDCRLCDGFFLSPVLENQWERLL